MGSKDPLSGVWYSGVGSKIELKVDGSTLTGLFHSSEGPQGKYELVGSVDPDSEIPDRAMSFSVSWIRPDVPDKYRSVSSYTGQYHRDDSYGGEIINTIFLLVDETRPSKQFASTFIGYDNFVRTRPSEDQIEKERRLRGSS